MEAPLLKYNFPIDHGDYLMNQNKLEDFQKILKSDINDSVVDRINFPTESFDFMLMVQNSSAYQNSNKSNISNIILQFVNKTNKKSKNNNLICFNGLK